MNQRQYQQLLTYRRNQELLLFYMIKMLTPETYTIREIINLVDIPIKRIYYILSKWEAKEYYEYGVSIFAGWLLVDKL